MRTELHRHLDACLRPATMVELARRFDVDVPFRTENELREKFWLTRQMSSLQEVLGRFVLFQKLLATTDVLKRLAVEAVEDAKAENLDQVEFRYSPSFTSSLSGIDWGEALEAIERGLKEGSEKTGIRVGLIGIVSREFDRELQEKTVDFVIERKRRFIGVDLAGPEIGYPCRDYATLFRRITDAGLPVTIHAGEAAGAENIWEAIDLLGARRIGHGINAIHDENLMKRLARDSILLETCPTSNYVTRSVKRWEDHPLPKFLEAGIPVSICTDDPGIFGNTMPLEYERCRKYLGMSGGDLKKIDAYAAKHSYLPS